MLVTYAGTLVEALFWRESIYSVSPMWAKTKIHVGDPPQDKKVEAEFWVGLDTGNMYSNSI